MTNCHEDRLEDVLDKQLVGEEEAHVEWIIIKSNKTDSLVKVMGVSTHYSHISYHSFSTCSVQHASHQCLQK